MFALSYKTSEWAAQNAMMVGGLLTEEERQLRYKKVVRPQKVSGVYLDVITKTCSVEDQVEIIFSLDLLFKRKDWHATKRDNHGAFSGSGCYNSESYSEMIQAVKSGEDIQVCFHSFVPIIDVIAVQCKSSEVVREIFDQWEMNDPVVGESVDLSCLPVSQDIYWTGVPPLSTDVQEIPGTLWYESIKESSLKSLAQFEILIEKFSLPCKTYKPMCLSHKTSLQNFMMILERKALLTHQEQIVDCGTVQDNLVPTQESRSETLLDKSTIFKGKGKIKDVTSSVYFKLEIENDVDEVRQDEVILYYPLSMLAKRVDWHANEYYNLGKVSHFITPDSHSHPPRNLLEGYNCNSLQKLLSFLKPNSTKDTYDGEVFEVCFHSFVPVADAAKIVVGDKHVKQVIEERLGLAIPVMYREPDVPFDTVETSWEDDLLWKGVRKLGPLVVTIPSRKWFACHYKSCVYSVKQLNKMISDGIL